MPPINAERLYDAFGLTPPEEIGGKVQESADPAAEGPTVQTDTGAQGREPAAPAAEVTDPMPEASALEEQPQVEGGDPPEKGTLTPEERRANAARRRQQEQQAAIDQAVANALQTQQRTMDAQLEDIFRNVGLVNNQTGAPIKTMEEFREWQKHQTMTQLQADLKMGKLTAEGITALIEQHPAIQQAQAMIQQNESARQQQEQAADQARIQDEITQIGQLDPSIKGVADLLTMPKAAEFKSYVDKGYSFLDAFKLANMEDLTQAKAERARQAAMLNTRGKDHIQATGNARGAGAAPVPSGQLEMFRRMNPGKSDAEIQKFYNNYIKRQGG